MPSLRDEVSSPSTYIVRTLNWLVWIDLVKSRCVLRPPDSEDRLMCVLQDRAVRRMVCFAALLERKYISA